MNIRKNAKMTDQVAVLNNHSDAVGEASYNLTDYACRAQYVNAIAAAEGSSSQLPAAGVGDQTRRQERQRKQKLNFHVYPYFHRMFLCMEGSFPL